MMNVAEALHCIGCGAELGLTPISHEASASWVCARCRTGHLDAFSSDDGIIHDCPRCGGQFISPEVLRTLVRRYQSSSMELPQRLRPNNPLSDRLTYLPCPQCGELMLRRNFGRVSGIIVDVCAAHGTWFDVGEVPRILGFIAQGGIGRGEAVRAEERRQHVSLQLGTIDTASSFSPLTDDVPTWDDLREAARSFVQWVYQVLR